MFICCQHNPLQCYFLHHYINRCVLSEIEKFKQVWTETWAVSSDSMPPLTSAAAGMESRR